MAIGKQMQARPDVSGSRESAGYGLDPTSIFDPENILGLNDRVESKDLAEQAITEKLKRFSKAMAKDPDVRPQAKIVYDLPYNTMAAVKTADTSPRGTVMLNAARGQTDENNYAKYGFGPEYNEILAHETGHVGRDAQEPDIYDAKRKDDLMYAYTDRNPGNPKESLSRKIKAHAIRNLEDQERTMEDKVQQDLRDQHPIFSRVFRPQVVKPRPIRESYEAIEKTVPPEKKHYWWDDKIP